MSSVDPDCADCGPDVAGLLGLAGPSTAESVAGGAGRAHAPMVTDRAAVRTTALNRFPFNATRYVQLLEFTH